MNCVVYKSANKNKAGYYLYVEQSDDFSRVPESLIGLMGDLEFVLKTCLSPEKSLAQVGVAEVMQQIQEQGFFLQMPQTSDYDSKKVQ
ncbi:MAG: YcgL domain-containing protein [Gammaproteobacteria bacterium]